VCLKRQLFFSFAENNPAGREVVVPGVLWTGHSESNRAITASGPRASVRAGAVLSAGSLSLNTSLHVRHVRLEDLDDFRLSEEVGPAD
jgi:hypothetical protein